jgi:hypothetical protein
MKTDTETDINTDMDTDMDRTGIRSMDMNRGTLIVPRMIKCKGVMPLLCD